MGFVEEVCRRNTAEKGIFERELVSQSVVLHDNLCTDHHLCSVNACFLSHHNVCCSPRCTTREKQSDLHVLNQPAWCHQNAPINEPPQEHPAANLRPALDG